MSIITNSSQLAGLKLSKASSIQKGYYACQRLGNVDMHTFAKFDQIYYVVQKGMSIFTNW